MAADNVSAVWDAAAAALDEPLLNASMPSWPPPNMTLEEYLEAMRGPKHLALSVVWPLTVIYVVIFVTGVIGNVVVCVVIVRNASMHTATNYYLFSLAVSDLALLLLGE